MQSKGKRERERESERGGERERERAESRPGQREQKKKRKREGRRRGREKEGNNECSARPASSISRSCRQAGGGWGRAYTYFSELSESSGVFSERYRNSTFQFFEYNFHSRVKLSSAGAWPRRPKKNLGRGKKTQRACEKGPWGAISVPSPHRDGSFGSL